MGLLWLVSGAAQADSPYVARGVTPTRLYTIRVAEMSGPERTLIGTLQGLLAKCCEEQIYIRPEAGGYDVWLQDLVDRYGVERIDVSDASWLVSHFQSEVNGYLLYQTGDDSVNVVLFD